MIPLHSMLISRELVLMIPTVLVIVCAALLGVAFLIGFGKGVRRVSWNGFTWLFTCGGFVLVSKFMGESLSSGGTDGVSKFIPTFGVAIACIVVVLLLHGVFSLIFRPRKVWKKDKDSEYDIYGFEYEPDYNDYDDYDDHRTYGKKLVKIGYGKPSFFGRLMGGLACMANVAMVLSVLLSLILLLVGATELKNGEFGAMFEIPLMQTAFEYATTYSLDFMTIGIMVSMANKGYKKGLIGSLRALLMAIGGVVVAVFCFSLPFTAKTGLAATITTRSAAFISKILKMEGVIAEIVGKIFAGLLLFAIGMVILSLINMVLGKCCKAIKGVKPVRILDGILACILYLLIGAVLCLGMWMLFYTLDSCELIFIGNLFGEKAPLSQGFFGVAKQYIQPVLDGFLGK